MNEQARQERNAYAREWRKRNKEKVKATQYKYWERKATQNVTWKEVK